MEVDPGDLIDTVIVSGESEQIDIAYRQAVEATFWIKDPIIIKTAKRNLTPSLLN
jgi:hypothetical protein